MTSKIAISALATIVFLSAGFAFAETYGVSGRGMGYFSLGLHKVNLDDFQDRLNRSRIGYPEHSGNFLSIGGGGFFCGRRWLIGGEGFALLGSKETEGSYWSGLSGGYGLAQFGYLLYQSEDLTFYPIFGLGGGMFSWKIQKASVPTDFDDLIASPEMGVSLNSSSFLLQAALGADYWIRTGGSSRRGGFCIVIGVRAGYTFAPAGNDWEVELEDRNVKLENGPDLGLTGPFVRVIIGFGGTGARRD
jgi:hypothetical protein